MRFFNRKTLHDILIFSSLVIDNRNNRERLEAQKLIRRFSKLYPEQIPHSFIHALNSIVSSSYTNALNQLTNPTMNIKTDPMIKCSLEFLCEIGRRSFSLRRSFLFLLVHQHLTIPLFSMNVMPSIQC